MRGYVSIDIETTGIDDKSHILQISAVFDDLKSPITKLKKVDIPIKYAIMTHCEPYAMGMNADLLKKMMDKDYGYDPDFAASILMTFLSECLAASVDEKGRTQKLILAGKNVASFDIPKIRAFLKGTRFEKDFESMIHYKTLDVGSLYYDVFKDNVSLSKINELTNRPAVSHNALDDAFDVVHAVRHKLGVSRE